MRRVASYQWSSPPPAAVDEELAVYDDGSAWLAVCRPRDGSAEIGTFLCRPSEEDLRALRRGTAAAGEGQHTTAREGPDAAGGEGLEAERVVFDLTSLPAGAAVAELMAIADRVALTGRAAPQAVAAFSSMALGAVRDERLELALVVVGHGVAAIEFELDPSSCAIHLGVDGGPPTWREMPDPAVGFVTPDAGGLGGIRSRAVIEPDVVGALTLEVATPGDVTTLSVQVVGWLHAALPDEMAPRRFGLRTAATVVPAP